MILIDTSVWVSHFRHSNNFLSDLLVSDAALTHPMILGEIACGTPPTRVQTINDIGLLQQTQQAAMSEVMAFIEDEKLYGSGCGLVDMVLLASTLMTPGALLWTLDKRLEALAGRFEVLYRPTLH